MKREYVLESSAEFTRLEAQSRFPAYDYRQELDGLEIPTRARILDAGCGSGVVSRYLAATYPRALVTGCDFSANRVKDATAAAAPFGLGNLDFQTRDLRALEFADQTFDVIVCRYVLEHLDAPAQLKTVAQFWRCLKPGGRLRVIDFDGYLYNLHPQPPGVAETLRQMEQDARIDLRVGRKLPALLESAGFAELVWDTQSIDCTGETLKSEARLTEERLTTALP